MFIRSKYGIMPFLIVAYLAGQTVYCIDPVKKTEISAEHIIQEPPAFVRGISAPALEQQTLAAFYARTPLDQRWWSTCKSFWTGRTFVSHSNTLYQWVLRYETKGANNPAETRLYELIQITSLAQFKHLMREMKNANYVAIPRIEKLLTALFFVKADDNDRTFPFRSGLTRCLLRLTALQQCWGDQHQKFFDELEILKGDLLASNAEKKLGSYQLIEQAIEALAQIHQGKLPSTWQNILLKAGLTGLVLAGTWHIASPRLHGALEALKSVGNYLKDPNRATKDAIAVAYTHVSELVVKDYLGKEEYEKRIKEKRVNDHNESAQSYIKQEFRNLVNAGLDTVDKREIKGGLLGRLTMKSAPTKNGNAAGQPPNK